MTACVAIPRRDNHGNVQVITDHLYVAQCPRRVRVQEIQQLLPIISRHDYGFKPFRITRRDNASLYTTLLLTHCV
ncbi:hypothetical protein Plhal304r1_c005g0022011 [Plasmopara halstedii]